MIAGLMRLNEISHLGTVPSLAERATHYDNGHLRAFGSSVGYEALSRRLPPSTISPSGDTLDLPSTCVHLRASCLQHTHMYSRTGYQ